MDYISVTAYLHLKTIKKAHTHFKLVKLHNPEDLHGDTLSCRSQLHFLKYELDF